MHCGIGQAEFDLGVLRIEPHGGGVVIHGFVRFLPGGRPRWRFRVRHRRCVTLEREVERLRLAFRWRGLSSQGIALLGHGPGMLQVEFAKMRVEIVLLVRVEHGDRLRVVDGFC